MRHDKRCTMSSSYNTFGRSQCYQHKNQQISEEIILLYIYIQSAVRTDVKLTSILAACGVPLIQAIESDTL